MNYRGVFDAAMRREANKFMRALAIEVEGKVVTKTPVDTGRARGNWNTSVGAPDTSVNDGATAADWSTRDANAREAIQSWDAWSGTALNVANGLPYIRRLEEGWSRQAPKGWVRLAVNDARAWIQKNAGRLGRG